MLKAITYARLCRALVYRGDLPRLGGDEKVEPVPISDNETVARVAYEQARADWNAGGVVGIRASELHDRLFVAADRVLEIRFLTLEELIE